MNNERISTFKVRLREALIKRAMTQIELSKSSKISKSLICRYLRGDCEAGNDKLLQLSKALNVSPVWLMGYDCDIDGKEKDDSTPPSNNKYIDDIISILNKQDNETLERILSMIKLMIK